MPNVLTELQIREIEVSHADGLTSQQIVGVFEERDVRFSEANLRRYVQLGLVPRSRRVGQKGKNLGSVGLYPVRCIRRINTIKRLMAEQHTLEEIQERFLTFKDSIESLDEALEEVVNLFSEKIAAQTDAERRARLQDELATLRERAERLLESVGRIEKLLTSTFDRRPRGGGAVSPTELL